MTVESWADVVSILGSIIIGLGVIGGAVWTLRAYLEERRRFPKANVSQSVQAIRLTDDAICIHTSARIQNIGSVMLSICSARNIAYQIRPLHDSMQESLRSGLEPYDELGKEIDWPIIAHREVNWPQRQLEIETGEDDTIDFDLLIPANVEVIQVYTYFANARKRNREIGWHSLNFYEVARISQLGGE